MALVLVVDDEYAIVETVVEALEFQGYECVSAANGSDAVDRARERRPDLIIMDVMMPILDGTEAVRRLKADPSLAAIPIILMSAAPRAVALAGLPEDAVFFLPKPFDLRTLLRTVAGRLSGAPAP